MAKIDKTILRQVRTYSLLAAALSLTPFAWFAYRESWPGLLFGGATISVIIFYIAYRVGAELSCPAIRNYILSDTSSHKEIATTWRETADAQLNALVRLYVLARQATNVGLGLLIFLGLLLLAIWITLE